MRKSLLLKYCVGGFLVFIKSYQAPFILLHRVEFLHWWEKSGHKYQFESRHLVLPRIHSPNTAGHLHILITLCFPPTTPHSNLIFQLRQSSCLSHILHSLANPMFSTRQDFLFRDKTHYHSPVIDSPVDKYSYLGMAVSIRVL